MKRFFQFLVLAVVAFFMLGCMEMFEINLFSEMDTPEVPTVEDIGGMEETVLLDTVENLMESNSFYQDIVAEIALSGTSETKAAIVENLSSVYSDDSDAPVEQQQGAALLVAAIELNTTSAGDVVDNFVAAATGFIDNPPDVSDPAQFTGTLVGQVFDGVSDEETFTATIDAMLAAADAYTYYGDSLDETPVPEDDNIGAIAQDAVVAILVAEMLDPATGLTEDDLSDFVLNDTPLPAFTIDDPLTTNTALSNILDASGLMSVLGFGSEM